MKLILCALAVFTSTTSFAYNNDAALAVCAKSMDKANYPEAAANCLLVANKGDYNVAAVTACGANGAEASPTDVVACITSVQNVPYNNLAANACATLIAQYWTDGLTCLQKTGNKNYSPGDIAACTYTITDADGNTSVDPNASTDPKVIAVCWESKGSIYDQGTGF
jgi:hypothetical protein